MIYLNNFTFLNEDQEFNFHMGVQRTCYDSFYPFNILTKHHFHRIDFEPITILYGGNGTGKTTALNVIAEKLQVKRDSMYNKSNFYADYVAMCNMEVDHPIPTDSRIITSDDVFDYMLNIRKINEGIDTKRDGMFDEYLDHKYSHFQMQSLADYDKLKKVTQARSKTQSKYVRSRLMDNVREYSNGESATRFFGCQFIISTHSPFVLSMRNAKIYDLDEDPVDVKRWTELENVRAYYNLFKKYENEFY